MTLIQSEPKKIYIWLNVADMQWPCPTGFHVPSSDEWTAVKTAMTTLGIDTSNGNCMKTYLKMPFAGSRNSSSADVIDQGTGAYYWSSTASSVDYAYCLFFYSAELNPQYAFRRSYGFSIRPFKDTPVTPDSDDTNWITIADKNLWATTVYNGDTLSQANCWNYYQWWNNYGFPRTWTVTKSSTKVDASNYWPWNRYSSSTFITVSASPYDWSSVQNDNLWWWVGLATKEIKRITIRPNGTEKQIRPVIPPYLCFTANTAGSTVQLTKTWSPTAVILETSTDWTTWTDYTIWNTITLSNIWDKVYFRNKSETPTWFSIDHNNYYTFVMSWSIAASWDITSLLNKNCTENLSAYCFIRLFLNCSSLTTPPSLLPTTLVTYCYYGMFFNCTNLMSCPELPATILAEGCCMYMFRWCTSLTTVCKLPVTTLATYCYNWMFYWCTNIKLSTTQTWEYQTAYRIPTTWTWTTASSALDSMFTSTWWTFTWTPTINTTYYTSNTLV